MVVSAVRKVRLSRPAVQKAIPREASLRASNRSDSRPDRGEKKAMTKAAYKRAEELGGNATVYGDKFVDGTHVLYVLPEKVDVYDKLPEKPTVPASIIVWKDFLKPLSLLAAGGVVAGSFLHYLIHGPKSPDEDQNQKGGGE
jgi:hypothetical protein